MIYYQNKKTLQLQELNLRRVMLPVLVMCLLFSSISSIGTYRIIKETIPVIYRTEEVKFSEKALWNEINSLNLQHKEIVYAQLRLESSNFSSQLFKIGNNFSGMKIAKSRVNTQNGEINGFSSYQNWRDCLIDYTLWQSMYAQNLSDSEYLDFLTKVYSQEPDYKNKIKELLKQKP